MMMCSGLPKKSQVKAHLCRYAEHHSWMDDAVTTTTSDDSLPLSSFRCGSTTHQFWLPLHLGFCLPASLSWH